MSTSCRLKCPQPVLTKKEILILMPIPSSQYLLNITSCCSKYTKPITEGIKYDSYDRVLRRRRGKAFSQ